MQNHKTPFVNWTLILANVAIFFLVQTPLGVNDVAFSFGLIPAVVNDIAVLPPEAVWVPEDVTYVSYAFLHADFWHLLGNMAFLWVFGDNIEDAMGHWRYALFYALCAAIAGLAHAFVLASAEGPLIGASGAVAGVIAAYLILHPKMRVWILVLGKIPLPVNALTCLGFWAVLQIYSFIAAPDSQVSWMSHIGGMVAGALLIPIFKYRHVPLFDRGLAISPE